MNDKADFTTIVSPRTYGLSTYTDEQLSDTAKGYLRTNLVQGLREAPSHIMRVEVTPKGVLAHCRYWREGDTVVNPKGSIQGKVLRDSNGQLFADFDGARSPLGGSLYPLLHGPLLPGDSVAPRHTPSIDLAFKLAQAEARAAQAEADSKLLLGELYSADLADEGGFFAWDGLLTNDGMTEAEMDAVRKLPTAGGDTLKLLAAVRRVVGKQ